MRIHWILTDETFSDMAVQNFVGDALRGATWVALHNGGGVGWGQVSENIFRQAGNTKYFHEETSWKIALRHSTNADASHNQQVINGGFGMLLDGTVEAHERAAALLAWDVNNGIARRGWSGNLSTSIS